MRYHAALAVAVLITLAPSLFAADEKTPAENGFERIEDALPKLLKEHTAAVVLKPKQEPNNFDQWCRVRVARMTSPETAKITLTVYRERRSDGERTTVTVGTLSLHLRWHRDVWTVTSHDANGAFAHPTSIFEAGYKESVVDIITAIDELSAPRK